MGNGRLLLLCLLAGFGCAPKKVCECAVYVGGTTPATEEEERALALGFAKASRIV